MEHLQFKTNQTAADYVSNGLDEGTQEAFELHMMGCSECVDDVEVWRAVKLDMPRPRPIVRSTPPSRRFAALSDWRMAASLMGVGVVGAAGGWFGKATVTPDIDSTEAVVYNAPAVTRGAGECAAVRMAADTRVAILRVPGVQRDLSVVALDSQKRELPSGKYSVRTQPDGSRLVRIDSQLLDGRAVHLEARHADGSGEPLLCVTGELPQSMGN